MATQTKVTEAASFVQQFFGRLGTEDHTEARLYEPSNLPLWMKEAAQYGLFTCRIAQDEVQITLIFPSPQLPFEQVTQLYRAFERMKQARALLVADELKPKARGVLVRMSIPHIITGSAVFAPQLGLAYGRIPPPLGDQILEQSISPVALKLTTAYLLEPHIFSDAPSLSALQLRLKHKYYDLSVATLSRAFQQLHILELVETTGQGPHKRMHFIERTEVWKKLFKTEMETVVRRVTTNELPHSNMGAPYVLSGESALGHFTNLLPPTSTTVAMSTTAYRRWKETPVDNKWGRKKLLIGDFESPAGTIELWHEDPIFMEREGCINPIDLVLSLRSHRDERVQIALSELLEKYNLDSKSLRRTY